MRIICKGRVYDLERFDRVCELPSGASKNEMGNLVNVKTELRIDKDSGLFYIYSGADSWYASFRKDVHVNPITRDEAAELAELYLDYEAYSRFFGDPEGGDAGLKREVEDAKKEAKSATDMRDYWQKEYNKKDESLKRVETELADLRAKLAGLTSDGDTK